MQGDDPHLSAGIREGEVLAGKYLVERVLGAGGMGVVVAARHLQLETQVAIKFLRPSMLANEEAVARFAREARAAVRITSEHVARVFDVGTLENGAPYMIMEYLDGADLSSWLHERGPLPIEEAIDFVLQACEAIAEAHALGIVHRDLKPANLFCIRSADGRSSIKVLDFGISKITSSGSGSSMVLTQSATPMGSPFYMSPEQMEANHAVDARTDVWALGVILYELITGKVPFHGETLPEVALKIATRPAPPFGEFRLDAPAGLEAVVARCLEKDRRRRYRSVAELALALLVFAPRRANASVEKVVAIMQAAGLSDTAVSPSSRPRGSQPSASHSIAPLGRTASGPKGSKAKVGMFLGIGVMALASGGALLHHFSADGATSDAGLASRPSLPAVATPGECAPDSARCGGTTPLTCNAGHWVGGSVTAGQCGAVCTPGSSPAQCGGNAPETCDSTGHWENAAVCPHACLEGACTGICVPGRTQCSRAGGVETCGLDGQWEKPLPCTRATRCRDGVCGRSAATASPPREVRPSSPPVTTPIPAQPDCDPPFTLDEQGQKHFKHECYPSSK